MNTLDQIAEPDLYRKIKLLYKNNGQEFFLADRLADNREVVLKNSLTANGNSRSAAKLAHEFEILKGLNHTGIPHVFDFTPGQKSVSLVQEYVSGKSLNEILFKGRLTYQQIFDIALQLAEILHYLHEQGIIYKNINTKNLLIDDERKLKLLDFGISSNFRSETNDILNIDQIEGSLPYISPEQTGRTAFAITFASDFYSFGVLLYELLVGKPPFYSVDPLEIIHFHLTRNPVSLATLLPDLPKGLDQVISKLMEKNPDDRYRTANGLIADLEKIIENYNSKNPLINFKAGLHDFVQTYQQSQKLYGRETEISELLGFYRNLNEIKSILVLVAGNSGVGKSALIRHVKYPIIQNNGTFLSGKFDQFKKDIPYYAFIQAIDEFIRNLLTEPEDIINFWKQRIISVLGENAGLITEIIPQLTKITGKQPEVPRLQPAEQETRFLMVLLDFIYVFSLTGRPLVLFLDDLQWADLSSLNFVRRILEKSRQDSILIIGAYRDTEVDKGHPLFITLKQIHDVKGSLKTIYLNPLTKEKTCEIVADSFSIPSEKAHELGKLVYEKTHGTPFFIHSFLKSLFEKNLIKLDGNNNWDWNRREIDKLGYTENVIELMTDSLIMLPVHTQEVLKLASILGNTFSLEDLSHIVNQPQTAVFNMLKPAIKGNLIHTTGFYRDFLFGSQTTRVQPESGKINRTLMFSFLHDKIQQAAYGLISPAEIEVLHLRIGRILLEKKDQSLFQDNIFEFLNHFAIGIDHIENIEEKRVVTELCLVAGRKAKEAISYSLGVRFLKIARKLLGYNSWVDNYTLTYNILFELGECEYLNNNTVKAERYFTEILTNSKTRFDKLKVYYLHSSLYLKLGNTQESLRLGLEAVRLYNIRFPKNKLAIQLLTLLKISKYLWLFSTRYKNPKTLFSLQDCTDEEIIALNKFLIDLATSAYMQDQNLMMLVIFKIIKSFLRNGFTDASGWGFSGFSVVVLSALKMQKRGFNLWDLTIKLHQRTNSPLIKWRLGFTVLSFSNTWRIPLRETFNDNLETIKACVLNGDQIFTVYATALNLRQRIWAGVNLREIYTTSDEHLLLIKNTEGGVDFFNFFYQVTKVLSGNSSGNTWDDDNFSGAETLKRIISEGNKTKIAYFYSAQSFLLHFTGHYKEAIDICNINILYAENFVGDILEAYLAFFKALSISASFETLNPSEKKSYRKEFKKQLNTFKKWTDGCPENFLQHYLLLKAEYSSFMNDFETAIKLFEESSDIAKTNGVTYVSALANERAAQLCIRNNLQKQSSLFLNDAWEDYSTWGANLKCKMLENAYPHILKSKSTETGIQTDNTPSLLQSSHSALDLASVLKASQSIAVEVKYYDLLRKLMNITLENAGAQRGCLILQKGNQLCIEAEDFAETDNFRLFSSLRLNETNQLPKSFINFCWRSDESIVIDNAYADDQFSNDPFVNENRILSMICLPITSKGKKTGMLYLENNLIKGAFNKNRIKTLQLLSGQIGISIDNAILYENLEEKVQERTEEIEKQKIQIQVEKEKSEKLLLNILPRKTAEELKSTGQYKAQSFNAVTVMFCDIVNFTSLAEKLDANTLVHELHEFFTGVDDIVSSYNIEKIKTIGDAYLCATGFDDSDHISSASLMINAALSILQFLEKLNLEKTEQNRLPFMIRIGIHIGPVTAGVVGKSKYAYDIWGDAVNVASRLETNSEKGRINISGELYEIIKNEFECEYRGKIDAKNKGSIDMFFVKTRLTNEKKT